MFWSVLISTLSIFVTHQWFPTFLFCFSIYVSDRSKHYNQRSKYLSSFHHTHQSWYEKTRSLLIHESLIVCLPYLDWSVLRSLKILLIRSLVENGLSVSVWPRNHCMSNQLYVMRINLLSYSFIIRLYRQLNSEVRFCHLPFREVREKNSCHDCSMICYTNKVFNWSVGKRVKKYSPHW